MKKLLYILSFLITLGCEDKIEKQPLTENSDLLVVEATLTNEKINHKIKLTHPFKELNGNSTPATGAIVSVFEGNAIQFTATEFPAGSGEYFTEELTAVFGKVYSLLIQYQGKDFFAESRSVPVQPMEVLRYDSIGDNQYRLILNEFGSDPYFTDHSISWQNTPSCLPGEVCDGRIIYYDLKTIDVQERFKPDQADFAFPLNSVVIRKKYSVSPDYKTFLRSVLSETQWRGGAFDVQRANAGSNLSEGAIGFFAVSTVLLDTTLIVKKP